MMLKKISSGLNIGFWLGVAVISSINIALSLLNKNNIVLIVFAIILSKRLKKEKLK